MTDHPSASGTRSSVPELVFVTEANEGQVEVLVNFGLFASRDATPAEIDHLGRRLVPLIGELTLVSEQRHEFGAHGQGTVHQVRVTVKRDKPGEPGELLDVLLEQSRQWARSCFADRHPSISDDLHNFL